MKGKCKGKCKGKGGVECGEKSLRCGRGVVSLRCGIIESDVKFILLVHKKTEKRQDQQKFVERNA